jgi:hypothetical protein
VLPRDGSGPSEAVTVAGARQGPTNPWSGPRLPRKIEPLLPDHDETAADPANGETVPRCWNCGRPGIGRHVRAFELWERRRSGHVLVGRWQLCSDCLVERGGTFMDPDPLTVAEVG